MLQREMACELVVAPLAHNELYLIVGRESLQVFKTKCLGFAGTRALYVHNFDYGSRHGLQWAPAAG